MVDVLRCGLSTADFNAYVACLRGSYTSVIAGHVLDAAGNFLQALPLVTDGQVDMDTTRSPVRTATVTIYDPDNTLQFDTSVPVDNVLFADRMLHLEHVTWVPALNTRVSCPLFTGPIDSYQRDGASVTVGAQGCEFYGLGETWTPLKLGKGMLKTDAIRAILAQRAGETRFSMPTLTNRLPDDLSLGRMTKPWNQAHSVALSMNRHLFYNASGRAVLTGFAQKPVFTLYDGDHTAAPSDTINPLQVGLDLSGTWYNAVDILGAFPKGAKTRLQATLQAPASHPLAPARIGRNGVPLIRVKQVQNSKLRTQAEVDAFAQRELDDVLRQPVTVTADVKPMPFLEEQDLLQFATPNSSFHWRLTSWSFPLGVGSPMTIGYNARLTADRKNVRA